MSEDRPDHEDGYQLVLPFIVVESQGGPFDDAAFVAGATCGALDEELKMAAVLQAIPPQRYVDTRLLKQIDLIAMRHGYTLVLGDLDIVSGHQAVAFNLA